MRWPDKCNIIADLTCNRKAVRIVEICCQGKCHHFLVTPSWWWRIFGTIKIVDVIMRSSNLRLAIRLQGECSKWGTSLSHSFVPRPKSSTWSIQTINCWRANHRFTGTALCCVLVPAQGSIGIASRVWDIPLHRYFQVKTGERTMFTCMLHLLTNRSKAVCRTKYITLSSDYTWYTSECIFRDRECGLPCLRFCVLALSVWRIIQCLQFVVGYILFSSINQIY